MYYKNCGHKMDPQPKWTIAISIVQDPKYVPLQLGSCAHAHPASLLALKSFFKMAPSAPCH